MSKLVFYLRSRCGVLLLIVPALFLFEACQSWSGSSTDSSKNKFELEPEEQDLSDEELADISLWKSSEQKVFIQQHLELSEGDAIRPYNPWLASYEGFQIALLLDLDEELSTEEMYLFIHGLFSDMPLELKTGTILRSIVISNWYDNGSPLVINVTRAFGKKKMPLSLYMFNTWEDIRVYGTPLIKSLGVAFEYPRIKDLGKVTMREFLDYYSIYWLDDGFLSSSSAVVEEIASFSSVSDDFDKLNLADKWLRDGNLDNDSEVFTVLTEIIAKDELDSQMNVFARMQLFLYYLVRGDAESAQSIIDELNASGLLDLPEVSETDVGTVAKRDLQRILDIAMRLSEDV